MPHSGESSPQVTCAYISLYSVEMKQRGDEKYTTFFDPLRNEKDVPFLRVQVIAIYSKKNLAPFSCWCKLRSRICKAVKSNTLLHFKCAWRRTLRAIYRWLLSSFRASVFDFLIHRLRDKSWTLSAYSNESFYTAPISTRRCAWFWNLNRKDKSNSLAFAKVWWLKEPLICIL